MTSEPVFELLEGPAVTSEAVGPSGAKMASACWHIFTGCPLRGVLKLRLELRWAKLEPRWRQVGQLGAKRVPRRSSWHHFGKNSGAFLGAWKRYLPKWPKCKNEQQSIVVA